VKDVKFVLGSCITELSFRSTVYVIILLQTLVAVSLIKASITVVGSTVFSMDAVYSYHIL